MGSYLASSLLTYAQADRVRTVQQMVESSVLLRLALSRLLRLLVTSLKQNNFIFSNLLTHIHILIEKKSIWSFLFPLHNSLRAYLHLAKRVFSRAIEQDAYFCLDSSLRRARLAFGAPACSHSIANVWQGAAQPSARPCNEGAVGQGKDERYGGDYCRCCCCCCSRWRHGVFASTRGQVSCCCGRGVCDTHRPRFPQHCESFCVSIILFACIICWFFSGLLLYSI